MKYRSLFLLFAPFIFQCSSPVQSTQPSPISSLSSTVVFDVCVFDSALNPVTKYNIDNVTCYMSVIPGNLNGNTSPSLIGSKPDSLHKLSMSFTNSSFLKDYSPHIFIPQPGDSMLKVMPDSVKFATLFPRIYDEDSITASLFPILLDTATKKPFNIIYVDRACTIWGSRKYLNTVYNYSIDLPSSGFFCLSYSSVSARKDLIECHAVNPPVFPCFAIYEKLLPIP